MQKIMLGLLCVIMVCASAYAGEDDNSNPIKTAGAPDPLPPITEEPDCSY